MLDSANLYLSPDVGVEFPRKRQTNTKQDHVESQFCGFCSVKRERLANPDYGQRVDCSWWKTSNPTASMFSIDLMHGYSLRSSISNLINGNGNGRNDPLRHLIASWPTHVGKRNRYGGSGMSLS